MCVYGLGVKAIQLKMENVSCILTAKYTFLPRHEENKIKTVCKKQRLIVPSLGVLAKIFALTF